MQTSIVCVFVKTHFIILQKRIELVDIIRFADHGRDPIWLGPDQFFWHRFRSTWSWSTAAEQKGLSMGHWWEQKSSDGGSGPTTHYHPVSHRSSLESWSQKTRASHGAKKTSSGKRDPHRTISSPGRPSHDCRGVFGVSPFDFWLNFLNISVHFLSTFRRSMYKIGWPKINQNQ